MEHDPRRRRRTTKYERRINRRYSNRISLTVNEEDFSDAILDPKTIDLSFLQKRETCGYNNLAQLSIQMADTECIISYTEISIPQDSSANEINNDGGTKTQLETVWKSDIVSVLLTKTNR